MTITLAEIEIGGRGEIKGYRNHQDKIRRKLSSMGLVPGTPFQVRRVAPMGDPIEISIMGYRLSLRLEEAKAVLAGRDQG